MTTAPRSSMHATGFIRPTAPARSAPASGILVALLLLGSLGCGAAAPTVQPTTPFLEGDAALFDRGISYITNPSALGGGWEAEWAEALERRVQRAEAIALVTGHTFREDTNPHREVTYRISLDVERKLYGELPDDLELLSRPGDEGFESVQGQEARILEQSFVVFVKWQLNDETGGVEPAFHLEPASETVVARVRELIERMHGVTNGTRTTVHYN
ncbi:MAG: hypothetical protein R3B40_23405 [Polyangiales bacterium]|nr:hypothetical protein [Myxococcales bacterium]MCB9661430.1 hypothetical protein [Sandaracinaceae bacterium]